MTFDPATTIERCPHDQENPYAQISRELIRDENISPTLRWMLIYLLSNKDGWKINPRQIINHLKTQGIGERKVYSVFREGIEAGYIERFTVLENNLSRVRYRISETPKFKKCLRHCSNGHVEDGDGEESNYKKEHPKEEHKKKEIRSNFRSDPPSAPKPRVKPPSVAKAPPPSAQALEISSFLSDKILEMKPDIKKPNIKKWSLTIDRMIRIDKKDPEKIKEVIEWVLADEFWRINILSADKLRKQFDRLELQMDQKASKMPENRIKQVHAWIRSSDKKEWLLEAKNKNLVDWGRDWMEFKGSREGYISFSDPKATSLITHWIRKMEDVPNLGQLLSSHA